MKNKWSIVGSSGTRYTVSLKNNTFQCNCIGYENHNKCYHSKYIQECFKKNIEPKEVIVKKINIFKF
mgnify:CR=1 FL=1